MLLLLNCTLKFQNKQNHYSEKPVIYVFWHRNILPMLIRHRFRKGVVIISSSKDGQLVAGPAQALGYITVRGSTTRGGGRAFREMLRLGRDHVLGITPDGPKGPAEVMTDGALYLALMTGLPIVPIRTEIDHEWILKTWDRFRIPKPFSKISVYYSEPVFIRNKDEIPVKMQVIQQILNEPIR